MIHVDTLKQALLLALFLFVAFQWASAENEIRNLVSVGVAAGEGWNRCITELEPRVGEVEVLTAEMLALPRIGS